MPSKKPRDLPKGFHWADRSKTKVRAYVPTPTGPVVKVFPDLMSAQVWREAAVDAVQRSLPIPEPIGRSKATGGPYMMFADAAEQWFPTAYGPSSRKAAKTVSAQEGHLRRVTVAMGRLRLCEVTPEVIDSYAEAMLKTLSVSTTSARLRVLNMVLQFAVKRTWLSGSPFLDAVVANHLPPRVRPKPRQVSAAEALSLMVNMRPEYRLAVALQRFCGLRRAEAYGIQVGDIDLDSRTIHIQRQGGRTAADGGDERGFVSRTKTELSTRVVGLPDQVVELLHWHLETFFSDPADDERLMPRVSSSWSSASYCRALRAAARVSGIFTVEGPPISSHYLRKSSVTDLLDQDVSDRVVSAVHGHITLDASVSRMTRGTYDNRALPLVYARAQAEAMTRSIARQVASLKVPEEYPSSDWATLAEAAASLAMVPETVRSKARLGRLFLVTVRLPGYRHPTTFVRRDSLEALHSELGGHLSFGEVAEALTVSVVQLRAIAATLGISIAHNGLPTDQLDVIREAVRSNASFSANHVSVPAAAAMLGCSVNSVKARIALGQLVEGSPPRGWTGRRGTRYVELSSVRRAGARGRPGEWLTRAEAALLIGVSVSQVNRAASSGRLDVRRPVGSRRTLISRASAEAYRDDRRSDLGA